MSKVYFASDHAGFALKNALIEHVRTLGYEVEDIGAFALNPEDDYPDFITPCAQKVAEENPRGEAARAFGIIIGGSGQGEAMCANRVKGIRAAVLYHFLPEIIQLAREHNDANILSLGARFLSVDEAREAVKIFLETPFSGDERHIRRLAKF